MPNHCARGLWVGSEPSLDISVRAIVAIANRQRRKRRGHPVEKFTAVGQRGRALGSYPYGQRGRAKGPPGKGAAPGKGAVLLGRIPMRLNTISSSPAISLKHARNAASAPIGAVGRSISGDAEKQSSYMDM